MPNRIVFDGMAELKAALRQLPEELRGEASNVVNATTNAAAVEIRTEYGKHRVSGRLQAGVVISHVNAGKYTAGAIVKNTAKIAGIFESGTQARHTHLGLNRGSMPPGHVFVPVIVRRRRQMYETLKAMLVRKGFLVSGDA